MQKVKTATKVRVGTGSQKSLPIKTTTVPPFPASPASIVLRAAVRRGSPPPGRHIARRATPSR